MADQKWIEEANSNIGKGIRVNLDENRAEEFINTKDAYFSADSWAWFTEP